MARSLAVLAFAGLLVAAPVAGRPDDAPPPAPGTGGSGAGHAPAPAPPEDDEYVPWNPDGDPDSNELPPWGVPDLPGARPADGGRGDGAEPLEA